MDIRLNYIVWSPPFKMSYSAFTFNEWITCINWLIVWYPSLFTSDSLIAHSSFVDCKHIAWFVMQSSLNVQTSFINYQSCWLIERGSFAGCKSCLFIQCANIIHLLQVHPLVVRSPFIGCAKFVHWLKHVH